MSPRGSVMTCARISVLHYITKNHICNQQNIYMVIEKSKKICNTCKILTKYKKGKKMSELGL